MREHVLYSQWWEERHGEAFKGLGTFTYLEKMEDGRALRSNGESKDVQGAEDFYQDLLKYLDTLFPTLEPTLVDVQKLEACIRDRLEKRKKGEVWDEKIAKEFNSILLSKNVYKKDAPLHEIIPSYSFSREAIDSPLLLSPTKLFTPYPDNIGDSRQRLVFSLEKILNIPQVVLQLTMEYENAPKPAPENLAKDFEYLISIWYSKSRDHGSDLQFFIDNFRQIMEHKNPNDSIRLSWGGGGLYTHFSNVKAAFIWMLRFFPFEKVLQASREILGEEGFQYVQLLMCLWLRSSKIKTHDIFITSTYQLSQKFGHFIPQDFVAGTINDMLSQEYKVKDEGEIPIIVTAKSPLLAGQLFVALPKSVSKFVSDIPLYSSPISNPRLVEIRSQDFKTALEMKVLSNLLSKETFSFRKILFGAKQDLSPEDKEIKEKMVDKNRDKIAQISNQYDANEKLLLLSELYDDILEFGVKTNLHLNTQIRLNEVLQKIDELYRSYLPLQICTTATERPKQVQQKSIFWKSLPKITEEAFLINLLSRVEKEAKAKGYSDYRLKNDIRMGIDPDHQLPALLSYKYFMYLNKKNLVVYKKDRDGLFTVQLHLEVRSNAIKWFGQALMYGPQNKIEEALQSLKTVSTHNHTMS